MKTEVGHGGYHCLRGKWQRSSNVNSDSVSKRLESIDPTRPKFALPAYRAGDIEKDRYGANEREDLSIDLFRGNGLAWIRTPGSSREYLRFTGTSPPTMQRMWPLPKRSTPAC